MSHVFAYQGDIPTTDPQCAALHLPIGSATHSGASQYRVDGTACFPALQSVRFEQKRRGGSLASYPAAPRAYYSRDMGSSRTYAASERYSLRSVEFLPNRKSSRRMP